MIISNRSWEIIIMMISAQILILEIILKPVMQLKVFNELKDADEICNEVLSLNMNDIFYIPCNIFSISVVPCKDITNCKEDKECDINESSQSSDEEDFHFQKDSKWTIYPRKNLIVPLTKKWWLRISMMESLISKIMETRRSRSYASVKKEEKTCEG